MGKDVLYSSGTKLVADILNRLDIKNYVIKCVISPFKVIIRQCGVNVLSW